MLIALHKNATTTPATRAAIQAATGSDYALTAKFGLSRDTIRKWRNRQGVHDASHTPHRLQTTLNTGQEELVVYLRQQLRLPLDDSAGGGPRVHRAADEPLGIGAAAAPARGLQAA